MKKLRNIFDESKSRFASSISLYEIYKLTMALEHRSVAELRVNTIEKDFTIVHVDSIIAIDGARISHKVKVPMADALIMATARTLRVPCATDDPHFTEVKKVWISE